MRDHLVKECDNKIEIHDMLEQSGKGGMRAYCRLCNRIYYLRSNQNGAPDKRLYNKLFYRWIVQPSKPLYYKVHKSKLRLIDITIQ